MIAIKVICFSEGMGKPSLFKYNLNKKGVTRMPVTNSPFRYPGGKTQLYNFISNLLVINGINGTYIEPFAGGAGVAIKLLLNNKVDRIWINDYDNAIYSVWFHILNNPELMIDKIKSVPFDYKSGHNYGEKISIEFWKKQRHIYLENRKNSLELAFATLFLNRTNRSGIIQGGPIGGMNQNKKTQIYARFNKKTLINKINRISNLKDKIKLTNLDASELISSIQRNSKSNNTFIFFDPPYFKQGGKLYFTSYNETGHKSLSNKIQSLTDYYWITTYDVDPHIKQFFSNCNKSFSYYLTYSANNKHRGLACEYLFASDKLKITSFPPVKLETIE